MGVTDRGQSHLKGKSRGSTGKLPTLPNGKAPPADRDELHDLIGNHAMQNELIREHLEDLEYDLNKAGRDLDRDAVKDQYSPEAWAKVPDAEEYLASWFKNQEQFYEDQAASLEQVIRPERVIPGQKGILLASQLEELRIWASPDPRSPVLEMATSGKLVEVEEVHGGWMRVIFNNNGTDLYGWVRTSLFCDQPDVVKAMGYEVSPNEAEAGSEHAETDSGTASQKGQSADAAPPGGPSARP